MNNNDEMFYIPFLKEWIKWLSYYPDFEKSRIEELGNKKAKNLTFDELKELTEHRERREMLPLIKEYSNNSGTSEENLMALNYIKNHSIDTLMLSKLTYAQVSRCLSNINSILVTHSDKDILKWIKESIKVYDSLNMEESFVLRHVIDTLYRKMYGKDYIESNNKIESSIKMVLSNS